MECVESLSTGVSMAVCDHVVYDIGIPDECPAEGCGLIVDFHPSNMTSADTDAHTNMQALGMAAGYVVVQPNNPAGAAAATLVRRVLDALIAALALDPTRVHVGGASLGGFMTWHFVCDHSDLIASAAPHASGTGNLPGESCDFDEGRSPSEQVDILMMHGRNDPTVPFSRGIEQRDLVLEAWDMDRSEVVVNGPEHLWTRWTNEQGTVVEFVEFDWESAATFGHCYPGADGRGGCGADNPVHYGEAALAFYLAHPKDG